MIGPKKTPHDFGFNKDRDYHIIINDITETCKVYNGKGVLQFEGPALARGQGSDREWQARFSDTPPGLYKVGGIYRDYESPNSTSMRDKLAYGWYSVDLIDLEDQESVGGRNGIMIHGGGSALGWPRCWAQKQPLLPTLGCVRMHNVDLRDHIVPLKQWNNNVYVSVYQES